MALSVRPFVCPSVNNPHAYFDGFQIVAVSFIAEFSFRFCCFVFDVKQLFKVRFVVNSDYNSRDVSIIHSPLTFKIRYGYELGE